MHLGTFYADQASVKTAGRYVRNIEGTKLDLAIFNPSLRCFKASSISTTYWAVMERAAR